MTAFVQPRMAGMRMRSGVDHGGGAGHSWCYQCMSGVNRGADGGGECSTSIITKQRPYQQKLTPRRDRIGDETTTCTCLLVKRVARQWCGSNPGSNGSLAQHSKKQGAGTLRCWRDAPGGSTAAIDLSVIVWKTSRSTGQQPQGDAAYMRICRSTECGAGGES